MRAVDPADCLGVIKGSWVQSRRPLAMTGDRPTATRIFRPASRDSTVRQQDSVCPRASPSTRDHAIRRPPPTNVGGTAGRSSDSRARPLSVTYWPSLPRLRSPVLHDGGRSHLSPACRTWHVVRDREHDVAMCPSTLPVVGVEQPRKIAGSAGSQLVPSDVSCAKSGPSPWAW